MHHSRFSPRAIAVRLALATLAVLALVGGDAAQALPGDRVAAFGSNGLARASVAGNAFIATAAARYRDGRFVVVGECAPAGQPTGFCITRFNADGSFNNAPGAFGSVFWRPVTPVGPSRPYAVAIDAEDRIVVAGHCAVVGGGAEFCLTRLLDNGLPDPSFANFNAEVVTLIGNGSASNAVFALAIQPDGRILAGGSCRLGAINAFGFCLARYLPNGVLDASFGSGGISLGYFQSNPNGTQDALRAMTLATNGDIVAVGECEVLAGMRRFCAMRFPANGGTQAGAAGAYDAGVAGSASFAYALAQQHDGNLIVGGTCSSGAATGNDFCLIRLTPTLQLDTSFGVNGIRRTPIGFQSRNDVIRGLAIQRDGRILAAGTCGLNPATAGDAFCWVRYMSSGEEDRSIHGNADGSGTIVTEFTATAANDRAVAALATGDGGLIDAGACEVNAGSGQYQACAAKYEGGPSPSAYCSPDLDGDGRFTPLIDGLIATRVAAGMRGIEVMQDIQLPPAAQRTGWNGNNGIADYLSRMCGVRGLIYSRLSS